MKKKGFTLVELLAVIAILAILVIMALPAVLRMFNQARIDTFSNEVNTIIRTTRQQYLLGGGVPQSFNSGSNKLPLTGNSSLEYCVSIDGNGKITELKATNGNYKYESSGIVDEVNSDEVSTAESNYELSCAGGSSSSSITYVNRQNEGSITVGDEVAIDTEHFYVISSDETNTVLLAKYNLLVGDVYNKNGSNWEFTKTLTTSDVGYGLQSETAKGYYNGATDYTGVVAFSGKGYWDNANCVSNGSGSTTCPGTAGLKSEYANSANAAGKTGTYSTPYPYVYNSSMSSVAPEYGIWSNPFRAAQDNGYTIAYYVEGYVNRLKSLGAPNNISGRLLTNEEANSLSSTIKGNWSYWLGSASSQYVVRDVYGGSLDGSFFWTDNSSGIRPVIVVPTNSMPN